MNSILAQAVEQITPVVLVVFAWPSVIAVGKLVTYRRSVDQQLKL